MHPTIQLALRAVRSVNEHYAYVTERLDLAKIDNTLAELISTCGHRVEQALERQLVRAHPDASFKGRRVELKGSGEMTWVVDPLVGYANLGRGYPAYALSLAIYLNARLEHVIIFNPATEEEFIASRGRGATLNGRRIRVIKGWQAEQAAVALPLPAGAQRTQHLQTYANLIAQLGVQDLITTGCTSLDICALAAGQLDAGIFLGADLEQLAPALLVLKEAGGLHGDLSGAPQLDANKRLLVANPKAFRLLVSQLKARLD